MILLIFFQNKISVGIDIFIKSRNIYWLTNFAAIVSECELIDKV